MGGSNLDEWVTGIFAFVGLLAVAALALGAVVLVAVAVIEALS